MATNNIKIDNIIYNAVPSITVPTEDDGTASYIDVTDTTAEAADVAVGKLFYTALGVLTAGTASGGGLEYETGSWTPTSNVARGEISFVNEHTTGPVAIFLYDTSPKDTIPTKSNLLFGFIDAYQLSGDKIPTGTTNESCAYALGTFLIPDPSTATYYQISHDYTEADPEGGDYNYTQHWATKAKFWPSTATGSRYWRAGRIYKWIAVWKPTEQ